MQGFHTNWSPSEGENKVYMGNRLESEVRAIGTYRLVLATGFELTLNNTLFVSSISRNLVSLSRLDKEGFIFHFGNRSLCMYKDNILLGTGYLCDGLYRLSLDSMFEQSLLTLHVSVRSKHGTHNEDS